MNPAENSKELIIPRSWVAPFFRKCGFVRGELIGFLGIPETVDEQAAARMWGDGLKPDGRVVMPTALAAIAAPQLIADICMLSGSRFLQISRLIIDSRKPQDPVYLVGGAPKTKAFRIQRLRSLKCPLASALRPLHYPKKAPAVTPDAIRQSVVRLLY